MEDNADRPRSVTCFGFFFFSILIIVRLVLALLVRGFSSV